MGTRRSALVPGTLDSSVKMELADRRHPRTRWCGAACGGGDQTSAARGGGRVAIRYTDASGFGLGQVTASGGVGFRNGSTGSVHLVAGIAP